MEQSLTRHTQARYVADLDAIKRAGVLRVLVRNNSAAYFVARGAQRGFQFELASAFAKSLGVRVAFVSPPSRDQLIGSLLSGEADLIAAGMTITPSRGEKVRFTRPVLKTHRVVVTAADHKTPVENLDDLRNLEIHLNFRSTTYRDAQRLEKLLGAPLNMVDITDGVEMEQMMRRVSEGRYEATIVDDNLVDQQVGEGLAIKSRISIGDALPKGWALHPGAGKLRVAADAFISKNRSLINVLYHRYFRPTARGAKHAKDAFRADRSGRLSPYDAMLKAAGEAEGIDWRLLAAIAYTESRFDPAAESRFGAQGLMQVLPSTARSLGFKDIRRPRENIRAGARYLKRLISRFDDPKIEKRQRVRFALAAYNAGLGHVLDARSLARKVGVDPDRWFRNVERALLLKKERKWHEKTKFGYCRAGETVKYVSQVQARYDVYSRLVPLGED